MIERPKIIFRPSADLKEDFIEKWLSLKIKDNYITQNKILVELLAMWTSGKIVLPFERNNK